MKYVKLIDYIDRPGMIRHVDGRDIKNIRHFPSNRPTAEVAVYYMHGSIEHFYKNGKYREADKHSSFVLKEDATESDPEPLFNHNQKEIPIRTERTIEVSLFLLNNIRVEGDKVIITLKGDVE